jgi:hypothetical protein
MMVTRRVFSLTRIVQRTAGLKNKDPVALNFSGNQVLFGCNPTEGIVALELDDDRHIRLYRRVQGKLLSELQ